MRGRSAGSAGICKSRAAPQVSNTCQSSRCPTSSSCGRATAAGRSTTQSTGSGVKPTLPLMKAASAVQSLKPRLCQRASSSAHSGAALARTRLSMASRPSSARDAPANCQLASHICRALPAPVHRLPASHADSRVNERSLASGRASTACTIRPSPPSACCQNDKVRPCAPPRVSHQYAPSGSRSMGASPAASKLRRACPRKRRNSGPGACSSAAHKAPMAAISSNAWRSLAW